MVYALSLSKACREIKIDVWKYKLTMIMGLGAFFVLPTVTRLHSQQPFSGAEDVSKARSKSLYVSSAKFQTRDLKFWIRTLERKQETY